MFLQPGVGDPLSSWYHVKRFLHWSFLLLAGLPWSIHVLNYWTTKGALLEWITSCTINNRKMKSSMKLFSVDAGPWITMIHWPASARFHTRFPSHARPPDALFLGDLELSRVTCWINTQVEMGSILTIYIRTCLLSKHHRIFSKSPTQEDSTRFSTWSRLANYSKNY